MLLVLDSPPMADELKTGLRALFASRLAALRKAKGWTAAQTAARAGCTESYWCKLEGGKQDPSMPMLANLARAFGLDEIDLFCFPGASERHDIHELVRLAPGEVRLKALDFIREQLARHWKSAHATGRDGSSSTKPHGKRTAR